MRQFVSWVVCWTLVIGVTIGTLAAPAAADIVIDQDSDYDGIEGNNEQAIKMNLTVSPEVVTEDLVLIVQESPEVLIDEDTLSSPDPGVEQSEQLPNRFEVDEIDDEQTILITFEAYAKSLQEAEVRVGTLLWSSEQVPDGDSEDLTANLPDSPVLQLEEANQRIADLESELDEIGFWRPLGIGLSIGGIVVATLALVGGFIWQRRRIEQWQETTFDKLTRTLNKIHNQEVQEHKDYEDGRDDAFDIIRRRVEEFGDEWGHETPEFGARDGTPGQFGESSSSTGGGFGSSDDGGLGSDDNSSETGESLGGTLGDDKE